MQVPLASPAERQHSYAVKLSIVTPAYNYGHFLPACLDSVQYQSVAPCEHLVIDNGSTDATAGVLSSHPTQPRTIRQEHTGLDVVLDRLLREATGDWVGWQNADDFYLPGAFETLHNVLAENADADIVVGETVFIDVEGRFTRLLGAHRVTKSVMLHYEMVPYAPGSYFLRREAANEVGVRLGTQFLMDKWLLADMVRSGARAVFVPIPICAMRRHPHQESNRFGGSAGAAERADFRAANGIQVDGVGMELSKLYGRSMHVGMKLLSGAYVRETRWRSRRGADCHWWTTQDHWLRAARPWQTRAA